MFKINYFKWFVFGIYWGILNFLMTSILLPYFQEDLVISKNIHNSLFIWLISGATFGLILGYLDRYIHKKFKEGDTDSQKDK